MTTGDHHVLLAQIATGDEDALRQLYTRLRPALRRYLWHQLDGDAIAVEEALQDTFFAVWRSASSFRGEAKVATWVYQIARYQSLHARRRTARVSAVTSYGPADEEGDEERASAAPSCEDEVVDRLTLSAALRQISRKHREALELVFAHGFTLEEAAAILDVPVGTVKSRVSYARRALLRELEAQALEDSRHDT
jgi:RNA polymerase sigma-70 factor (ECF subfamily)